MSRFRFLPPSLLTCLAFLPASAQQQELAPVQPGLAVQPALPGGRVVRGTTPATPAINDAEALKFAGLSETEPEKLIGYLKLRTVSEADQGKIQILIKRLGADRFNDRIQAGEELELFGPAAIGLLKTAEKDSDPEIAYQASRVLKRMEKIPHSAVAAAAVRALVKLKHPGSAAALLGFLPLADSEVLADDIRGALVAIAAPGGKPDAALVAALADPSPIRRGAAYQALIEGGPANERIRIKESFEQVKAAIRKEEDVEQKFRALWSLILTTREKEFIPDLIAMTPQLPRGRIWQLEDLLLQLAGKVPEGGRFGKSPEALAKARDVWAAWWEQKSGSIDLVKLAYKPRIQGFTDIVEYDRTGNGNGRFVSLGPDLKEKHSFMSSSLFEAKMMPNGRITTIENYSQVLDRDLSGAVQKTRNVNQQPVAFQALPDGGMLLVSRQFIYEYDKDGAQKWVYQRQNTADIVSGCRLPGGDTLFITMAQQGSNCFRLDGKGNLKDKTGIAVGRMQNYGYTQGIEAISDETLLMCEGNQVAEYDLKTGKVGWKYSVNLPTGVQRLPNGNTLIAAHNNNRSRAIEIDSTGEVLWEYTSKDGHLILKAYRR